MDEKCLFAAAFVVVFTMMLATPRLAAGSPATAPQSLHGDTVVSGLGPDRGSSRWPWRIPQPVPAPEPFRGYAPRVMPAPAVPRHVGQELRRRAVVSEAPISPLLLLGTALAGIGLMHRRRSVRHPWADS
ncbi:MAG: hypothetical protein AAF074_06915 [Pseudomonadota bacterium]